MKKFLQFLGGAVVAASVIPYAWSKDEESGQQNFQALLWKASVRSQVEEGEKKLSVTFGFNNPFQAPAAEPLAEDEADLFADEEPVMHYQPVCECECSSECAEMNPQCCGEALADIAEDALEAVADAAEDAAEELTDPAE